MNLLEMNLFKNCEEGKSGVVFISTNKNQACRILILDGSIVAVNMGLFKGFDALKELKNVGIKQVSYKDGMTLPYKDEEKIASSDSALTFLGYSGSSVESQQVAGEPAISEAVDEVSIENEPPKKKVRIYRGQIVED